MEHLTHFTPYRAVIGGLLIGLSSVLFLWLHGRIVGISGFVHALCPPKKPFPFWRLVFLFGLVLGGAAYYVFPIVQFPLRTDYPVYLLLLGGFCVGFGTRMAKGCTSGHSICGVARLSLRSFVATLIFILSAAVTVYLLRNVGGFY